MITTGYATNAANNSIKNHNQRQIMSQTIDFQKHFKKSKDFTFQRHNKEVFEKKLVQVGDKKIRLISREIFESDKKIKERGGTNADLLTTAADCSSIPWQQSEGSKHSIDGTSPTAPAQTQPFQTDKLRQHQKQPPNSLLFFQEQSTSSAATNEDFSIINCE